MTNVRPARADELGAAAELVLRAYDEYRVHIPERYWDYYAADLADTAGRAAKGTVLVAERDGRLAGCASLLPREGDAEAVHLRVLAVDPAVRKAGVGRAMMDDVFARARAAGARRLVWETGSFMAPARGLYRALGFEPDPEPYELVPGIFLLTFRAEL